MKQAIEDLIYQEAQLLDEGRLEAWLDLYTEDATYWVPIDESADPLQEASIIYDDHLRLKMRVEQIVNQARVAQNPASQMVRMVTNLRITEESPTEASAQFCMQLSELRSGDWRQTGLGDIRVFPSRCFLKARRVGTEWKITQKKIVLLQRYQPIVGLSFII